MVTGASRAAPSASAEPSNAFAIIQAIASNWALNITWFAH
jgi:hypothetical protein